MPKFSFTLDVADKPEEVIAKMVDFSDRRPDIWPMLSKKIFKVNKLGKTSADVVEGTDAPGGGVWGRENYDWSQPNTVKSKLTDSNVFKPGGTFEMKVEPKGSGSRIFFSTHRQGGTVMSKLVGAFMQVTNGAPIRKNFLKVYGKPK